MNHAQFHAAVRNIANCRYFVTEIRVSEHSAVEPLRFDYGAYIDGLKWVHAPTAEGALSALVVPDPATESEADPLPASPPAPQPRSADELATAGEPVF